jgi:outer membrane lipoprotein-sorting protein
MNRAVSVCLAIVLAQAAATDAQSLAPADIKALLGKIRERRATAPHVEADFREEKTIHLMARPIVSSGRVWFQPPDKFRREVKGNSPSITVTDGQQLWIYYPNFKSAEHYTLGKRSPLDSAIATINTALNLENVEGTFEINGSKTNSGYELRLLPRTSSMKRIFRTFDLWLDNEFFVTRTEMSQPNGDKIVTIYTNPSRAPIPPGTFEFTPPPGTDVSTPMGR